MNTLAEITDAVKSGCERHSGRVAFAYLFGSLTKNEITPRSDIDIAIYFSKEVRKEDYFELKLQLYVELCRGLKRDDVDIVVLNSAMNLMLLGEILRFGRVVYDREPVMREDYEVKMLHRFIDFKTHRLAVMGV